MNLRHATIRFLLLGLLSLTTIGLRAQQVIFCEQVSSDGKPLNASDYFSIKRDGGFLQVLVTLSNPVGTDEVRADLFRREKGRSVFESSVFIPTDPSYRWFAHKLTFFKEGEYEVFFYDKREKLLAAGGIRLQVR